MSDALLTSYEEVPYESKPIYRTHPDGLATVAAVYGLEPPPIERCRVLELGGASGGNVIAMAVTLPRAEFVNLDLSPRQIADGQNVVDALGLKNVTLRAMSLTDVPRDFGVFDYILCHGVFSWVPPPVQDAILNVCRRHLAPNGLAYISYNTYPGWHLRGMIRDMMRYHTAGRESPQERVAQARALLDFLVEVTEGADTNYAALLREEARLIGAGSDSYLFHEQLEEFNLPLYFHQFAARAAERGLRFVAEAQFSRFDLDLPPRVAGSLDDWTSDPIRREQYLDFLRNRTFRRSILCHADRPAPTGPRAAGIRTMYVSALARPTGVVEAADSSVGEFQAPDGARLSTNHPVVKAALLRLFERWPQPIAFEALYDLTWERLGDSPMAAALAGEDGKAFLAEAVLHCYLSNVAELHLAPPGFTLAIGAKPVASPLARLQAAAGQARVTSLSHRTVELDVMDRLVLGYLDGEHDEAALLDEVVRLAVDGKLVVRQGNEPLTDPERLRGYFRPIVGMALRRLAAGALLCP